MRRALKIVASLLVTVGVLGMLGCRKHHEPTLSYETIVITECVRLGAYEGLTVALDIRLS